MNGKVWSPMHDTMVDARLPTLPCGGTPLWDAPSECGYRCDLCNAIIGSVGQSPKCVELNKNGEGR